MSGTFVTKFSLFTITNKVFHTSNKEQTNISNKDDVYYEWGVSKSSCLGSLLKTYVALGFPVGNFPLSPRDQKLFTSMKFFTKS